MGGETGPFGGRLCCLWGPFPGVKRPIIFYESNIMITARIYRPSRSATQSGTSLAKFWVLEFEPAAPREIDPLMGWTSSRDMRSQVKLKFATKEEAIAYARKNGLSYELEEPPPEPRKILSYSDNFKSTRRA